MDRCRRSLSSTSKQAKGSTRALAVRTRRGSTTLSSLRPTVLEVVRRVKTSPCLPLLDRVIVHFRSLPRSPQKLFQNGPNECALSFSFDSRAEDKFLMHSLVPQLHESSAASEVSSAYETGSIAHNEEAVSDTGHDDDTPLRILERIIENQFDRLRQDLKASAARSVDTQPLPSLVDDRLQTLLSATIDKFASQLLSSLAPEFVSLADGQQAVARTVRQSQDETRALKAAFAQLDLDIASRQDAAYAAFGERLDPVGAVQSRDSTRAGPLEEVDDSHKAASENEVQRLKAELNVAKGEISALEKRLASRVCCGTLHSHYG